jgi:hypothetical protein
LFLRLRLPLTLGLAVLGCGGAEPRTSPPRGAAASNAPESAHAGPADSPASGPSASGTDPARAPLAVGVQGFCVHGGAPAVGAPLVDRLGRLYLVTQDGYLHSYEPDGRFRFSFTVSGTPLGSPSLRPSDEAVLLGTTARSVYGIRPDGQLSFRASTLTPVWSGLHARDMRSVIYIGLDRYLYALSNHGVALYRVPIPGQPVGEPAVAPGGVVWIPLDSGLARIHEALSVQRFATAAPVDQVVLGARGPFALSGGQLWSFAQDGTAQAHGPAEGLVGDGTSVLAWDGAGGGTWFPGGDVSHAVALGVLADLRPSGTAGLSGEQALLPLEGGEVALLDLAGPGAPGVRRLKVLTEPLELAAFTPGQARLLVTSRGGRACLLDDPFGAARTPKTSR